MKLKNILIVVSDIERSKKYYSDLFGLSVVTDFGENVILSEGLVLQEINTWERFVGKAVQKGGNDAELYFEENDMDAFLKKLKSSGYEIDYVNELMEHDWGQRVIRIYDPDRHIIEVGESLRYVAIRYLKMGWSARKVSEKVQLPLEDIEKMAWEEDR